MSAVLEHTTQPCFD